MTSILTTIMMVAVVISIGVSVWGFANSAATVMRSDYFDEVMESVYKIKERFRIENIGVNISVVGSIEVWVLNYGETEVNITRIKVSGGGNEMYYYPPDNEIALNPGEFRRFNVLQDTVEFRKGNSITVMVESSRENKAYETTKLP
jgi:hypothetical protein